MTKNELLRKIGFSEEYISYLEKVEDHDNHIFEAINDEFQTQTCDETNVIVDESINDFSTIFNMHPK